MRLHLLSHIDENNSKGSGHRVTVSSIGDMPLVPARDLPFLGIPPRLIGFVEAVGRSLVGYLNGQAVYINPASNEYVSEIVSALELTPLGITKGVGVLGTTARSLLREGAVALTDHTSPLAQSIYPKFPANNYKLKYSLASEQQMRETGSIIAGPGTQDPFRDAPRIVSQYGGKLEEWVKKSSSQYKPIDGKPFETHWVENLRTGERIEFKIDIKEKK